MTLRLYIYIENLLMNVLVGSIGNRHQKTLWDSGAGTHVISFDCYQSIPTNYKTELYPSSIKNKSCKWHFYYQQRRVWLDICDWLWKVHISFPLLRSIIPTNYFGSQFCQSIPHRHLEGSRWHYTPDNTWQTILADKLPTTINALVFCRERAVITPYSYGYIQLKVPKENVFECIWAFIKI